MKAAWRSTCLVGFCAAGAMLSASARALPPEPSFLEGFYAGGGVGAAKDRNLDESTLADPFAPQDLTLAVRDADDWELAWHAFVGYQVCRFFALEGAYTGLGDFSLDALVVEDPGGFSGELSPTAWSVSGLVTTPPWKGLSVFGRIGAAFWKAELDVSDRFASGLLARDQTDRGTSLVWGFGARWDFSKHVGIRAEWERFEKVGDRSETGGADFDVLLGSLVFSF